MVLCKAIWYVQSQHWLIAFFMLDGFIGQWPKQTNKQTNEKNPPIIWKWLGTKTGQKMSEKLDNIWRKTLKDVQKAKTTKNIGK